MSNFEKGIFIFEGVFNSIKSISSDAGKWRMFKAIFEYETKGVLPDEKIANSGIFLLVKAMIDGKKEKNSTKTGAQNNAEKKPINALPSSHQNNSKSNQKLTPQNHPQKMTPIYNKNKKNNENKNKIKNSILSLEDEDDNFMREEQAPPLQVLAEVWREEQAQVVQRGNECCEFEERREQAPALRGDEEDNFMREEQAPIVQDRNGCLGVEQQKKEGKKNVPNFNQVEAFIKKTKLKVVPEVFYHYYNDKGWTIRGEPIKDWHLLLVEWSKRATKTSYINRSYSEDDLNKLFDNLDNIEI